MSNSLKSLIAVVVFSSRWLQLPLYLGLIVVQSIYVYEFVRELYELTHAARHLSEAQIMLHVLGLIDVVMIANLLVMVIVGGYETFVSRLNLDDHPDQPDWLDHVNAGTMKIKLAMALIGISSIHLLKTFINPAELSRDSVIFQIVIHLTFVVSALIMAYTHKVVAGSEMPAPNTSTARAH